MIHLCKRGQSERSIRMSLSLEAVLLKEFKKKCQSLGVKHTDALRNFIRGICNDEISITIIEEGTK